MAKKEKKQKRARLTKERIRRWLNIQDINKVYFALQLVFIALQALLLFVLLEGSVQPAIPLIYCAVLLLFAWKSNYAVCRFFIRFIPAVTLTAVLAAIVGFFVVAKDVTGVVPYTLTLQERLGFAASYMVIDFEPLWLLCLPALAMAARLGGKKADIVLLHIGAWGGFVLAAGNLVLKYSNLAGYTLMFKGLTLSFFTADLLLWVYAVAALALVFGVFMLYPFGTKRIKALVEKTRAKLNKE